MPKMDSDILMPMHMAMLPSSFAHTVYLAPIIQLLSFVSHDAPFVAAGCLPFGCATLVGRCRDVVWPWFFQRRWFWSLVVLLFLCSQIWVPFNLALPPSHSVLEWSATDFGRNVGLNDLDTTFRNPSFASDLVGKWDHCSTIQASKPIAKKGASTRSYR